MDPEPTNFIVALFNSIDFVLVLNVISLVILMVVSALVSGAEVAFFSLSPTDIDKAHESLNANDDTVIKLLDKPDELLATILIANNFVNVAIVLFTTFLSDKIISIYFDGLTAFLIQVVGITFLILMFGEVVPKIYANINALNFARFMSKPFKILIPIFRFISLPLLKASSVIERRLKKNESNISVSHLEHALEITLDDSSTSPKEQKILEGIVNFGNTDAKQIMQPRIDMFAINQAEDFDFVLKEILSNGYSRLPVYRKDLDNIKGLLYVKDLLPHINADSKFNWSRLVKPAIFVPENKKLDDILKDFQDKKIHLAIVVDEYGGTSGLITLEDVIEEIVGDISDEFDVDEISYSKIDNNNYSFEGKTNLKDFYRIIDIKNEDVFENSKGESDTLAGMVLELAGGFPSLGDEINFSNYIFTVEALDNKRIKQIKITIKDEE
ncbi:MAG: gliding motility-associated protein GldE [Ichthyobacteriaceae bacterium]|nr:gliding motility-associated protein GldE [Ichthyobacteriaceae bacterium]